MCNDICYGLSDEFQGLYSHPILVDSLCRCDFFFVHIKNMNFREAK